MGAHLEPQLREALREAWQNRTAEGTGLAGDPFGDATARAEFVYEVICCLYDEAKFRTPGPTAETERSHLGEVGNAARTYADEMFARTRA